MKFDVRSDRALIRTAGGSRRYILVSFAAPVVPPKIRRMPINVSFVLDRSGSMAGERKIELVQEAVDKAIGMLREDDRFSVVIYDDKINVLMESTTASSEAKRAARKQLETVTARGNTNLGGGWLCGCEQAAMHLGDDVFAKCLLLTDGLANEGITDRSELVRHAEELRRRAVLTSTFGVGSDFDEVLLQQMADAGGGHSYYVEKAVQIPDFLTSELGETLEVVARDTALQFRLPVGVEAAPLNRYRFECSSESLMIDLGNVVSGQELEIAVELCFPVGNIGDKMSASVCLTDRDGVMDAKPVDLYWTFADHAANDAQPRDRAVDSAVANLYAAKAHDKALEYNRKGEFDAARAEMRETARRIREYAGSNEILLQLADALEREAEEYHQLMSAIARKTRHFGSHYMMKGRDAMGKSKRSDS